MPVLRCESYLFVDHDLVVQSLFIHLFSIIKIPIEYFVGNVEVNEATSGL